MKDLQQHMSYKFVQVWGVDSSQQLKSVRSPHDPTQNKLCAVEDLSLFYSTSYILLL